MLNDAEHSGQTNTTLLSHLRTKEMLGDVEDDVW